MSKKLSVETKCKELYPDSKKNQKQCNRELKKMSKWAIRAEKILKRIPTMPKIKIPMPKIGLSRKRRR